MVERLLLGTTAGFVAVAGAQAADYPVKAAAVQYVKICNLYGDGFYYLPGTDICVKIGGYARAETTYDSHGLAGIANGPFAAASTNAGAGGTSAPGQANSFLADRADGHDWEYRSRAYISLDSREQTTLRTYVNIGLNYDSPASALLELLPLERLRRHRLEGDCLYGQLRWRHIKHVVDRRAAP